MEEMGLLTVLLSTRMDAILKRTDAQHAAKDAKRLQDMREAVLKHLDDRRERMRKYMDKLRHWERLLLGTDGSTSSPKRKRRSRSRSGSRGRSP